MTEDGIQTRDSLELRDYLAVIKHRFWVIPLTAVVFLAVALGLSLFSTSQYRASTRLLYQKTNLEQAVFGLQVFSTASASQDRDFKTGTILVKLQPVAEAVKEQLGSPRSSSSLLGMVRVRVQSDTNVVDIIAEGPDPEECAAVANAFAEQFILFRQTSDRQTVAAARELVGQELQSLTGQELESQYGIQLKQKYDDLRIIEAMQNGGFTIVQAATVPGKRFSPTPLRDGVVAAVLGLIAGIGLAFLLDYLDRGIKDEKTLEKALGAPVLTRVPLLGGRGTGKKKTPWMFDAVGFIRHPILLEPFRTLRSNLEFFAREKQRSVWMVTSSEPQEGKSTTVVNLALSLALSGKRVVVIDADLRRPVIHEYMGIEQNPGLSSVLAGGQRLERTLQLVNADDFIPAAGRRGPGQEKAGLMQRNIYMLPAGPVPPNPAELLSSSRMAELIESLAEMCDCVLIDAPPLLAVSDAITIARHADGVMVATRMGKTTRDQLREVREVFERAGIKVLGAVAVTSHRAVVHRYGYGYEHGSAAETKQAGRTTSTR